LHLHRALLNAKLSANLFVRASRNQHVENFLLAIDEGYATYRERNNRTQSKEKVTEGKLRE